MKLEDKILRDKIAFRVMEEVMSLELTAEKIASLSFELAAAMMEARRLADLPPEREEIHLDGCGEDPVLPPMFEFCQSCRCRSYGGFCDTCGLSGTFAAPECPNCNGPLREDGVCPNRQCYL